MAEWPEKIELAFNHTGKLTFADRGFFGDQDPGETRTYISEGEVSEDSETCPKCAGSGWITKSYILRERAPGMGGGGVSNSRCPVCHGTGKGVSEDSVRVVLTREEACSLLPGELEMRYAAPGQVHVGSGPGIAKICAALTDQGKGDGDG